MGITWIGWAAAAVAPAFVAPPAAVFTFTLLPVVALLLLLLLLAAAAATAEALELILGVAEGRLVALKWFSIARLLGDLCLSVVVSQPQALNTHHTYWKSE